MVCFFTLFALLLRANTKDEPRFIIRPVTQIVEVGADIILDCSVNGTAPITMEWQKDGQEVVADDRVMIERYAGGVVSVFIVNAQLTDSGLYSCYAFNSFGTAEYEVEVFVTCKALNSLYIDCIVQQQGHAYYSIFLG